VTTEGQNMARFLKWDKCSHDVQLEDKNGIYSNFCHKCAHAMQLWQNNFRSRDGAACMALVSLNTHNFRRLFTNFANNCSVVNTNPLLRADLTGLCLASSLVQSSVADMIHKHFQQWSDMALALPPLVMVKAQQFWCQWKPFLSE
jgi:hypothetical protein